MPKFKTFREEILGVLGAFGRTPFLDEHFRWDSVFKMIVDELVEKAGCAQARILEFLEGPGIRNGYGSLIANNRSHLERQDFGRASPQHFRSPQP